MDLEKYLKSVTNLNDYIYFTRELEFKRIDLKIPFNMSTVLSLKKIRSIEIEYFSKCDENGAATTIFELMLRSPPSKTWSLLGKELVGVLQYWLEAVRKYLIIHNINWWTFLKMLLKFIKDIHLKDPSMSKLLIEETAECLLGLATHSVPDAAQRTALVQAFNCFCTESSRSVWLAYREQFQKNFEKLSTILARAGDFRLQYSILETLLRWLLPRHDPAVRQDAAAMWFPTAVFGKRAVDIFLERSWQNFMKDARDFLNAFNEIGELVTSVPYKKLTIGTNICFSAKFKTEYWLDVNSETKCISIMVVPTLIATLGGGGVNQNCDALIITEENSYIIELNKLSQEVTITASVYDLTQVYPFDGIVDTSTYNICLTVESRCDLARLDKALLAAFQGKYQILFDIEDFKSLPLPENKPESLDFINDTEEDPRFSMPTDERPKKRSDYIVRPRLPGSLNSPSTASTSSLAQLHEKLASLPQYSYDKEPVSVCAQPQLSSVTEVSESEENNSVNASLSTIGLRTCGVCKKKNVTAKNSTSRSNIDYSKETCNLAPVVNDNENSVSCLLVATIGSADDSVINDTIERLPKDIPCNTDNIVDLLAQEALQARSKQYCNINAEAENKTDFLQIEQYGKSVIEKASQFTHEYEFDQAKNFANNPDFDELSNEVADNTPANITVRKSTRLKENKTTKCIAETVNSNEVDDPALPIHDIQPVEDFFTQHDGGLLISPTLAKKINETNSECNEDFDKCLITNKYGFDEDNDSDFYDIEVTECLNTTIDKVSKDFNKCTRYLDLRTENKTAKVKAKKSVKAQGPRYPMNNTKEIASEEREKPKSKTIKLKINTKRLSSKINPKAQNKEDKNRPFVIMSPIIERESVVEEQLTKNRSPVTPKIVEKPKSLRKRKLYSPKDEEVCDVNKVVDVIESSEHNSTSASEVKVYCKTPSSTTICYKELEKERKKRIRQPRTRKFNTSAVSTSSSRTLKNNKNFDSLKDVVEGERVTLINKNKVAEEIIAYNFTSDSEQGITKTDAKVKTSEKGSQTPEITVETLKNNSKNEAAKRKRYLSTTTVLTRSQKEIISKLEPALNLEDERVRSEVPEILNISILIERPEDTEKPVSKEPELMLKENPQLESIISDDIELIEHNEENVKRNAPNNKSKKMLSLKRNVIKRKDNLDTTVDHTLKCVYTKDDPKIMEKYQKNATHNTRNTRSKKILSLNRSNKDIMKNNLDTSSVDNEKTISPLPGLVVETDLLGQGNRNDTSINDISEKMLKKFKDIYQGKAVDETEANTTQNLLSDVDPNNDVSIQLNITEELNKEVVKRPTKNTCKRVNTKSSKETDSTEKNEKKKLTKKEILKIKQERRSFKKQTSEAEIILISPETEVSERTMNTLGNTQSPITGHGDFNENPPSSTLLNTKIEPRIVEQEYLNQSLKEFFSKLNKDVEDANDETYNKSDDSKGSSKRNSKPNSCLVTKSNTKSPVVTITRLSSEDIRLLTSNCSKPSSGDISISKPISKVSSIQIIQETSKGSSKRNSKPNSCLVTKSNTKSPVVTITRLSSEDIRLLTSSCSKPSSGDISISKPISKVSSIQIIQETTTAVIETHKDRTVRIHSKSPNAQNTTARISIISPIKSFEDMSDLDKIEPFVSEKGLENYRTISSSKLQSMQSSRVNAKVNKKPVKVNKIVKKPAKETMVTSNTVTSKPSSVTEGLTRGNSISSRTSVASKRKSTPILGPSKKSKLEVNNNMGSAVLRSGPSLDVSNVDEWFKRNEPSSPADTLNLSIKENIKNVLEKLDTTLLEIHHNTSRRFINMFVDTQKCLKDIAEKRQRLYRQTASDILSGLVKILDEKFSELDKKSEAMDEEFMSQVKEKAHDVIREECKQKRVMVTLLREDVQAVFDHLSSQEGIL